MSPAWAIPSPALVTPFGHLLAAEGPVTQAPIENGSESTTAGRATANRHEQPDEPEHERGGGQASCRARAWRARNGGRSADADHGAQLGLWLRSGAGSGGAASNIGAGCPPGACGGSQPEMFGSSAQNSVSIQSIIERSSLPSRSIWWRPAPRACA